MDKAQACEKVSRIGGFGLMREPSAKAGEKPPGEKGNEGDNAGCDVVLV
jgi:hypothetical protein